MIRPAYRHIPDADRPLHRDGCRGRTARPELRGGMIGLHVKLTPEQYERLVRAAGASGVSVQELIVSGAVIAAEWADP